jgi:phosphoribosylamine--glycine ligase
MGSYSPVLDLPAGLVEQAMREVINPTAAQMAEDGDPLTGFLYAGLALTGDGLKVVEFNVRLGDPETQAILPRLDSDLVDLLEGGEPSWTETCTVNVVLAAKGYPTSPEMGAVVRGIEEIPDDVLVFHAGTRREGRKLFVDGGRVLNVVGTGDNLVQAREAAYSAARSITWPGIHYRTDIAS